MRTRIGTHLDRADRSGERLYRTARPNIDDHSAQTAPVRSGMCALVRTEDVAEGGGAAASTAARVQGRMLSG